MTAAAESTAPAPLLDLQRLGVGIRWRKRMWISIALLGLLLGGLFGALVPPQPTAVSRLLIVHENDVPSDVGNLMATDVALIQTSRIAAAALKQIGATDNPQSFVKQYEAIGLTSNVLELTVEAGTDRAAVARANALAEIYLADHVRRTQEGAQADAQALLDQRKNVQRELAEIDKEIAGKSDPTAAGIDTLYARRAELGAKVQELGRAADEAGVGSPRVAAGSQVVDAPHTITRSRLVSGALIGGIGLLAGLALGLTFAAVAAVVRDRPVLRRDVTANLGASVIAQLPLPPRGPARVWRRSRDTAKRQKVTAAVARAVHGDQRSVSFLHLGAPDTAAMLAVGVAGRLASEQNVLLVDDLRGKQLRRAVAAARSPVSVLDSSDPAFDHLARGQRHIGVGAVEPGTAWTDLEHLGAQTVLVVRAGHASTLWLHTVARQLAAARIPIIGVVLVHPDPRDRTDGTLWDGLHTALRGRSLAVPSASRNGDHSTEQFAAVRPGATDDAGVR